MNKAIILTAALLAAFFLRPAEAKKKLQFDEEHGIVFVDDKQPQAKERLSVPRPPAAPPETASVQYVRKTIRVEAEELLQNKKATPENFYQTGLRFYRNSDYEEALRFFAKALELTKKPEYSFWMGLCYRALGDTAAMLTRFEQILDQHPQSPVADDCLFYIAFTYQLRRDYETAVKKYKDLIEFYPDGVSAINYTEFRDRARRCLASIKITVISMLSALGYGQESMAANLRRFQARKGLPVTGAMDKRTINLLTQAYGVLEEASLKKSEAKQINAQRRVLFLGIFGSGFLLNIVWGLALLSLIRHRLDQVDVLVQYNFKP